MVQEQEHWLSRYANNYHAWKKDFIEGHTIFKRPIGLVESSFDSDGEDYGGRADMTALLTLALRHTLSKEDFRRRITLAWTSLRLQHVLLQSKVIDCEETGKRTFVVEVPSSFEDAVHQTSDSIVWMEDSYDTVDDGELFRHAHNVGRIVDSTKCLSRLHVLPVIPQPDGTLKLRFLMIMAHQTSDGLTFYNWLAHFLQIFNLPVSQIEQDIETCRTTEAISKRLPPAQEDLYPIVSGSRARQRWFWAIMRVLRHVKKQPPPTFTNPLRREHRMQEAIPLSPTYDETFDYSATSKPPLTALNIAPSLSPAASARLISLCRSINVSVGAGCFALVALSMMTLHEKLYPHMAPSERPSFAASFPLNPRPFFGHTVAPDSCMLAFSSGITMPFLPSSLPLEGRFRLLAKIANRELRMYQKRLKKWGDGTDKILDAHSPGRILADLYLTLVERVEGKLPPNRRTGHNPQGGLPAAVPLYGATCGVSSVGSTAAFFRPGQYDLGAVERGTSDFAVDYRHVRLGVRARDNEFLCACWTRADGVVEFSVSFDGCGIGERAAEEWAYVLKGLLEVEAGPKL